MRWRDTLGFATRAITRRGTRTILTIVAVALAAALLTALLTIATTARTRVLAGLSRGGPLATIKVAAAAPDPGSAEADDPKPGAARPLDQAVLRQISRLPDVETVHPVIANSWLIVPPPNGRIDGRGDPQPEPFFDSVVGVDLSVPSSLPVSLLAGRLPEPASLTEAAVTPNYLERIGLDPKQPAGVIGQRIEMAAPRVFGGVGGTPVRGLWVKAYVVGVVAQDAAAGDLVVPIQQTSRAQRFTDAGNEGFGITHASSPYTGLLVVARGLDDIGTVRRQITAIGYSTSAPENLITSVLRYLHVVEIVLAGIGLIALVIAALGVADALAAAVRERRREIGIMKALGARDRDVLRTFALEAAMIGLAGGVLGTALGWLVARIVAIFVNGYLTKQGLSGVALSISAAVTAGGIAGSAALALLAGAAPALRAARLPARVAMESP
jgi:macrolide transport system ATP-binding/permease protein